MSGYEKERTLRDVFVKCGWDVEAARQIVAGRMAEEDGVMEEEEVHLWERLEEARQAAGERFDGGEFERQKADWERLTFGGEDRDSNGS